MMAMNPSDMIAAIRRHGLIAIVRGNFPFDHVLAIGETLATAGVNLIEVTLNSAGALQIIGALRARLGDDVMVGAGTVRRAEQLAAVIDAGAQFSLAPGFDPATVEYSQHRDFLHIPGVFTPSEAETAHAAGCRLLKLFPADVVGPAYLQALRAPLDDIAFIPTGGVSVANIAAYRRAGAAAVGIGSALVQGNEQTLENVARRARALREAWGMQV